MAEQQQRILQPFVQVDVAGHGLVAAHVGAQAVDEIGDGGRCTSRCCAVTYAQFVVAFDDREVLLSLGTRKRAEE